MAIVFGILLAFGIDAWYDGVRENERETDYQRRIATELERLVGSIEALGRSASRSQDYANAVANFLSGHDESVDPDWLVVALYNIGRDYLGPLDTTTYEDAVSTGSLALISDSDVREAIRRAYALVDRLEASRDPYRDEYLAGVRGWLPQQVVDQIREACPNFSRSEEFVCRDIDIDDNVAEEVMRQMSGEQARLAFQLRHQGLDGHARLLEFTLQAVETALAQLSES